MSNGSSAAYHHHHPLASVIRHAETPSSAWHEHLDATKNIRATQEIVNITSRKTRVIIQLVKILKPSSSLLTCVMHKKKSTSHTKNTDNFPPCWCYLAGCQVWTAVELLCCGVTTTANSGERPGPGSRQASPRVSASHPQQAPGTLPSPSSEPFPRSGDLGGREKDERGDNRQMIENPDICHCDTEAWSLSLRLYYVLIGSWWPQPCYSRLNLTFLVVIKSNHLMTTIHNDINWPIEKDTRK